MDRENNSGCLAVLQRIFNVNQNSAQVASAYDGFERFQIKRDFFHHSEVKFYKTLKVVVGEKYEIFSQVGMGGLFSVGKGAGPSWQTLRNKIERKRIDFLLCDPNSMQPVLGIELDGSSHKRSDRKKSDADKDAVFRAAGLPLIHVSVQRKYDPQKIADQIMDMLR